MLKFIIALLLTALLSFIGGLYCDWWVIAIVAFLVAILVHQKAWKAFLAGFLALFLLWAGLACWIDRQNDSLLSARIGELMGIGARPLLLVLATGLIAALVGGFAALSGSYLRSKR